MATNPSCPDPSRLMLLLDRELPDKEQAELTSHLDACEVCQKTVEDMASGGKSWAEVAGYLRQEKPGGLVEPGLKRVLQEPNGQATLTRTVSTDEQGEADPPEQRSTADTEAEPGQGHAETLAFLSPSADPNHLGRLDNYAILEVVGQGGMGIVLKAFDEHLHRIVAVKVLAPQLATSASARRRFIREAQAAAAVCHDHVVTIHAVNAGSVPYLVMQLVAGFSLQDKLEKTGPLGIKEILRIGLQTAEGLAAAHKQGLVHRDIKPANILLENGVERVKITDFGLARAVDDASLTQSGVVAGTPQYMSPEQAQGEPVDHRSDLFSLGSVLYAMCTGRPPFRASGTMAVLKRVCEETPRSIREINPDIPEWLCDIIAKLHAKKPGDRFQSATEVADLLSRHLAHLQQPMLAPAPIIQPSGGRRLDAQTVNLFPPIGRNRVLRGLLAAFFVLGFLIFMIMSYSAFADVTNGPGWLKAFAGVILVSFGFTGVVFLLLWIGRRKPSEHAAPPRRVRRWRHLVEAVVVLAIGAAAFAWLDYTHPAWWKEPWMFSGQPDHTPGSVSINWNDPEVEIVIDNEEGTSYSSRQSPFRQRLNPGIYTYQAMKGGKPLFEVAGKLAVSPGEERVIDLSGWVWPPLLAKTPFTAGEAKQHQEAWAKHLGVPVEIENAIGMKFRLIPPGEFLMGMTQEEIEAANKDRPPDHWLLSSTKTSGPQHKVTLSKPFYCATTEVTIGQFRRFVEATGYQTDAEKDGKGGARWDERQKKMTQDPRLNWKTPGYDVTDNSPVTQVTWNDAVAFCNWLNAMQGLGEAYRSIQGPWWRPTSAKGCRLPTEAQWEFACRAGATTNYFWGTDEGMLKEYAWYSDNSSGKAHPVASRAANPFGLFDMQGNVSELCQDFHDNKEYNSLDVIDPEGAQTGTCYVRRGANFASQSKDCASAQRLLGLPFDVRHDDTGFRVVQDIQLGVNASPARAKAPFTSEEAKQHQQAWAKHLGVPVETTNSAGMKLALIPPGEFNMGLTAAEIEAAITRIKNRPNDNWLVYAYKTSGPLHKVVLTKPYYAATTHVTIGQFREFVKAKKYLTDAERDGKGGSRWDDQQNKMIQDPKLIWKTPGYDVTDQSPVTEVTWNDAVAFCNWLSAKEGLGQPYELVEGSWRPTSAPGYRLPTEAQWEYACRAGTTSLYVGGNDEEAFARYAWFVRNSNGKAQPVGAKLPNAFGLFDMQGNADQFCQDFFDPKYYERNERYDPLGPDTGLPQAQPHVRRGSSWACSADLYLTGLRNGLDLKDRQGGVGFRVVRDVLPAAKALPPSAAKAPFTSDEAQQHQEAWAKHLGVPVDIENAIGTRLRLIPPGEFLMGSTQEEIEPHLAIAKKENWRELIDLLPLEKPRHSVRLTKPFYLGTYEVTQGEYQHVMGTNPSHFSASGPGKDKVKGEDTSRLPVENVGWLNAVEFCNRLSKRGNRSPCYRREGNQVQILDGTGYRLPTEAEWEYACRAGSTASYCFGDDMVQAREYAWFAHNSEGRTHAVGQKLPNAFGLFDMHGNVWECCQDSFLAYPPSAITNPALANGRVTRGGSWDLSPIESRCSYRGQVPASEGGDYHHGFRVVLNAASGMELPSRPFSDKSIPPALAKAPFTADEAKLHQKTWAKHLGVPVETTISTGMKFALVPPGEFNMGLSAKEIEAAMPRIKNRPYDDWLVYAYETSGPLHKVVLSRPYYVATTHVTIGQFREFVKAKKYLTDAERDGKGGSRWDEQQKKMIQDPNLTWKAPEYEVTDDSPVTQITWNDAVAFCNWLSAKEGLAEPYELIQGSWRPTSAPGYRLPTESQWEFACRAGTTSLYFGGNDEEALAKHAWFDKNARGNEPHGKAHPVGTKLPNAFGLFDMQGNAMQLCQDFFDPKYYERSEEYDPIGPTTGPKHARRGGAWATNSDVCLSGLRMSLEPQDRQATVGFRIVRDIPTNPAKMSEPGNSPNQSSDLMKDNFDAKPPGEWTKAVAALPAEEQVKAVVGKLKALNPGFDGNVSSTSNYGVVTQLVLVTDQVTDITPVLALTGLKQLGIKGSQPGKSRLADLWPLHGMKLREIEGDFEPARDSPILRSIKTLETINHMPVAEFWKTVDVVTIEAADCLGRGWDYAEAGKWPEAEAEFKKAVDHRSLDPQVWMWRGRIYAEGKRYEQSASDFNKALDRVNIDPNENPMKPWSQDRVGIDDELCRWDEVFARVAQLRPKDARLWIARTRWFAYRGDWKAAGEASAQVVKRDPWNLSTWFMDAPLRLQNGDIEGYRRDCSEMRTRFGKAEDTWSADLVGKTCLLTPDAVADLSSVFNQAYRTIKDTEKSPYFGWYMLCASLADYRAGKWQSAIEHARSVLANRPEPSRDATALIILAMSQKRCGQAAEARTSLQEARALMDKSMPQASRGERFNETWSDWLRCHILLREAEKVVEKEDNGSKK